MQPAAQSEETNGNGHPPYVDVKTAPINLNLSQKADPPAKVKKEIILQHNKQGRCIGATVTETPVDGPVPIQKKVSLKRGKPHRLEDGDLLELP